MLQGGAKTSKRLDDVIEEGATAGALNKNYAIVREASDDEVAEFDRLIGKTEGAPSPTPGQEAQGINCHGKDVPRCSHSSNLRSPHLLGLARVRPIGCSHSSNLRSPHLMVRSPLICSVKPQV